VRDFLRSGLGWGKYVQSVFEPTPPGPTPLTPAQIQQLTPGLQQFQPALPPPPQPTGTFNTPRVIQLRAPISAPTPVNTTPMSTGEKVAIGVGGVVLLAGLYLVLRK
jgi:hypothetical protein